MYYAPGDLTDSTKTLLTTFLLNDCDISLELGLSVSNYGIWYKEDADYVAAPNRYFSFTINNSIGFNGILSQIKSWNTSTPTANVSFDGVKNVNLIIDSISASFNFYDVYFRDNNIIRFKGFNNYGSVFSNCYALSLNIEQVESQGNGGSISFLGCFSRNYAWSSGFNLSLQSPCNVIFENSALYQQSTSANLGAINIYSGAVASTVTVRNSTLLSRTSSNISIYSAASTTGANYIYNSVLSDTVSTNFHYTGAGNNFVTY